MPSPSRILRLDSYLAMIRNSVGSTAYRQSFMRQDGRKVDLLKSGRLSCAYFVSGMLRQFNLITSMHASVDGTVRDMEQRGWKNIRKVRPGAVLVWEAVTAGAGEAHRHIGFAISSDRAISNSTKKRCIALHHLTFGRLRGKPKRAIETIYWHASLK